MKLLSAKETISIEPNVNKNIKGALYAPSAGIVSPYEMAIAFAENAYKNGVDIKLNTEVLDIEKNNAGFMVFSGKGEFITKTIRKFAGLRAESDRGDFIVSESKDAKGFFNATSIKSPGLSSAPALAGYLSNMILSGFPDITRKDNFVYDRKHPLLQFMTKEEKAERLVREPLYSKIVCRCEKITEGEIMDAASRFPYPSTKYGVKRRARAGMGPCQGNFCGPKVEKILKNIKYN